MADAASDLEGMSRPEDMPSTQAIARPQEIDYISPVKSKWRTEMPQLEQIEAIEKRLWKAADTLRANSNYASNEYFLPVMGLVFLQHAYSRFLAVKDYIEAGLPRRGGKARPLAKEDFSQRGGISSIVLSI